MKELLERILIGYYCRIPDNLAEDIREELENTNPVAWFNRRKRAVYMNKYHDDDEPLYTTQPAQQNPVLLSEHEIRREADAAGTWTGSRFARAVEMSVLKANGINHD